MDYKPTLNLPKTSFPMKADLPKREPVVISRWQKMDLYKKVRQARKAKEPFVLHDGPPYANGDIHIGHALNKIIKDIIVRYKTMRGFDSPYVPGWDCHGMPIEHQLFKELNLTKHQINRIDFRSKARTYAQRWVEIQRAQFKRLGVTGDWDNPYLTMDKDYELTILRILRHLLQAGFITRRKKPVYWCTSCETALAEAEVEYEDREDHSIYVEFPLRKEFAGVVAPQGIWDGAGILVWTTTPWTLPGNVALCFHPEHTYSLVSVRSEDGKQRKLVVASELVDQVLPKLKVTMVQKLLELQGKDLGASAVGGERSLVCEHPYGRPDSVGVCDEQISLQEGTGIVHIAPGHGEQDYQIGQREGLEVFSPIDDQGRYTQDMPRWKGEVVWDANPKIIDDLRLRERLLAEEKITHSYPHCWRCKRPVIFRATPQWFLRVTEAFRDKLVDSVKQVSWVPSLGLNRISGMLESRPDWCLSRQRYWGTPIPILHCTRCDRSLTEAGVLEETESTLSKRGVDSWFALSPKELAPSAKCPDCPGSELRKETDILDVWFDSGVSHEAVLKKRADLGWPAALYVEGSDQHRGWFQVSLIPAVALHGQPPYQQVLTHGFVVDGEGRKMSKSLGNVIAPEDVLKRYGADILRLWVASCDYSEDVRISEEILAQVAESYRKIRNTFRFLLSNLDDFDPLRQKIPEVKDWPELDRWAMTEVHRLWQTVTQAYDGYQFHEVFRAIYQYCVVELSGFYLDALKDRLYTEAGDSAKRRCAQATLYAILSGLVRALAPVLAVTADEVWQVMHDKGWVKEPSVHLALWPDEKMFRGCLDEGGLKRWESFRPMRDCIMKALEEQRAQRLIGSPLEAWVTLKIGDRALQQDCEAHRETLAEAFVVSRVDIEADGKSAGEYRDVPGLVGIEVERAKAEKCERCWKRVTSVGTERAHPKLCDRCAGVVG